MHLKPDYQVVSSGTAPTLTEASNDSVVAVMFPIAFGRGAGAGSRASMAVTILGGQVLCLLRTLLVTPVVYAYLDDVRQWDVRVFVRRASVWPPRASIRS